MLAQQERAPRADAVAAFFGVYDTLKVMVNDLECNSPEDTLPRSRHNGPPYRRTVHYNALLHDTPSLK